MYPFKQNAIVSYQDTKIVTLDGCGVEKQADKSEEAAGATKH